MLFGYKYKSHANLDRKIRPNYLEDLGAKRSGFVEVEGLGEPLEGGVVDVGQVGGSVAHRLNLHTSTNKLK